MANINEIYFFTNIAMTEILHSRIIKIMIPLKDYKKIHELMPILCVDIAIMNGKNEFLLVKRKNKPAQGEWWFPGGRVKKGELMHQAASRKVEEETGLKVKNLKFLGMDETLFPDGPFSDPTHTVNGVFLAKTGIRSRIRLDKQSEEYGWFSEIDKRWHSYIKKFIKLALKNI